MITVKSQETSTNYVVTTLLGLLNFSSDYHTLIEIKDHSNVYFIHLPPYIERMGNLYSSYSKKTHLYKFLVSYYLLK